VTIDAVVLAGGRSSRLSGTPKAALIYRGISLLDRAVQAALDADARAVVVVGTQRTTIADARIASTREEPPFGGPAAGIGAGIAALARIHADHSADFTLVLACDLPEVARAIEPLLNSIPLAGGVDGLLLVDADDRQQPLTAVYRSTALAAAVDSRSHHAPLEGLSMRALIADLRLDSVPATCGTTADVDTWADAASHGIAVPPEFATTITQEE